MHKIPLFEISSMYRDNMRVYGYLFGAESLETAPEKTIAIVAGLRGNELEQMFEASQLVHKLKHLEELGRLAEDKTILVIPSANPYSINSGKRFWPTDNTDINRMFPGYDKGETTQRIAAELFKVLEGFEYGIHLTSHYISGNFVPHISIQNIGRSYDEYLSDAKDFGLPYIRFREPSFYDTTTLNYNWQVWDTRAFSIYGGEDSIVNEEVAERVINAILNFMNSKGIVQFGHHRGYISSIMTDENLSVIKSEKAGFLEVAVKIGDFVHENQLLAKILDTGDGHTLCELRSPVDGAVFFIQSSPLALEKGQLLLIAR